MDRLQSQLVAVLHTISGYNDKGYERLGHTIEQSRHERAKARREIDDLIEEIGPDCFDLDLLRALKSEDAVLDFTGRFAEDAERWFNRARQEAHG